MLSAHITHISEESEILMTMFDLQASKNKLFFFFKLFLPVYYG